MRKIKASHIYNLIKDACEKEKIIFNKRGYRAAKRAYNMLSWTRRHLV